MIIDEQGYRILTLLTTGWLSKLLDPTYAGGTSLEVKGRLRRCAYELRDKLKEFQVINFIDYCVSDNCKRLSDTYGEICIKCGECGRKFERGVLIKPEQVVVNNKGRTSVNPKTQLP